MSSILPLPEKSPDQYNKELLCKDCKHVKSDWMSRLLNVSSGFVCTLPESWIPPEYDPVVGLQKEGYFQRARTMRYSRTCGAGATKWVSSKRKHLFLMLRKVHTD